MGIIRNRTGGCKKIKTFEKMKGMTDRWALYRTPENHRRQEWLEAISGGMGWNTFRDRITK